MSDTDKEIGIIPIKTRCSYCEKDKMFHAHFKGKDESWIIMCDACWAELMKEGTLKEEAK